MARKIVVIHRVKFESALGLEVLQNHPHPHPCPLRWGEAQTGHQPDVIAWVWQPITGEAHCGLRRSHRGIIPSPHRFGRRAWLRGFYFPQKKLLVARPFFWPRNDEEFWDLSFERQHTHVATTFMCLIRYELPPDTVYRISADNRWLKNHCDLLVRD